MKAFIKIALLLLLVILGACKDSSTSPVKPPEEPSLIFTSDLSTIPYNGTVALSWTSNAPNSLVASGDWSGKKNRSGTETVLNLISNKTYILTCSLNGKSISKSVTITVGAAPTPTVKITTDSKGEIPSGSLVKISWVSTNAFKVDGVGFNTGGATSGSITDTIRVPTKYSAVAIGAENKTATDSVFVSVKEVLILGGYWQGGIIYFLDNSGKHGLIAAGNDIQQANQKNAIQNCESLILNGYDDWFCPNFDQLKLMQENMHLIGGFVSQSYWNDCYWSSSPDPTSTSGIWARAIRWYTPPLNPGAIVLVPTEEKNNVRPIRKF